MLPTNSYTVRTNSVRERLVVLTLLIELGYKWHGNEDLTPSQVQQSWPFATWPHVRVDTTGQGLSGTWTGTCGALSFGQFIAHFHIPAGYELAEGSDVIDAGYKWVVAGENVSRWHAVLGSLSGVGRTVAQASKAYAEFVGDGSRTLWVRPIKAPTPPPSITEGALITSQIPVLKRLPQGEYTVAVKSRSELETVMTLLVALGYKALYESRLKTVGDFVAQYHSYPYVVVNHCGVAGALNARGHRSVGGLVLTSTQFLDYFGIPPGFEVAPQSDVVLCGYRIQNLNQVGTSNIHLVSVTGRTVAEQSSAYSAVYFRPIAVPAPVSTQREQDEDAVTALMKKHALGGSRTRTMVLEAIWEERKALLAPFIKPSQDGGTEMYLWDVRCYLNERHPRTVQALKDLSERLRAVA